MPNYPVSHRPHRSKKFLWTVLVVLVLIAIVGGLKLTVFKSSVQGAEVGNSGSQNTKGEPLNQNQTSSKDGVATTTNPQPGDQKSDTGSGTTSATLLTPSGNFVSNHMPDQAHPGETSVCTTTPGATCQINFTKDGVTKSLAAQTTDRGGSAYWNNWKPADIGLTAGSWKVQAVAGLNGKTLTADDAIELTVTQ